MVNVITDVKATETKGIASGQHDDAMGARIHFAHRMTLPYTYTAQGRRPATAVSVALVWAAIGVAHIWLDAALPVSLTLAAFTLPALYDLVANPRSTITLDAHHLRWHSGRQQVQIALREIDHLRFDTRLDMSVRLSVLRPSGATIRVPYPATPPHMIFEALAQQAGLKTRRHHFSLMG